MWVGKDDRATVLSVFGVENFSSLERHVGTLEGAEVWLEQGPSSESDGLIKVRRPQDPGPWILGRVASKKEAKSASVVLVLLGLRNQERFLNAIESGWLKDPVVVEDYVWAAVLVLLLGVGMVLL